MWSESEPEEARSLSFLGNCNNSQDGAARHQSQYMKSAFDPCLSTAITCLPRKRLDECLDCVRAVPPFFLAAKKVSCK